VCVVPHLAFARRWPQIRDGSNACAGSEVNLAIAEVRAAVVIACVTAVASAVSMSRRA
jgi:hypothetical protein